jgi:hypothetical protein
VDAGAETLNAAIHDIGYMVWGINQSINLAQNIQQGSAKAHNLLEHEE